MFRSRRFHHANDDHNQLNSLEKTQFDFENVKMKFFLPKRMFEALLIHIWHGHEKSVRIGDNRRIIIVFKILKREKNENSN